MLVNYYLTLGYPGDVGPDISKDNIVHVSLFIVKFMETTIMRFSFELSLTLVLWICITTIHCIWLLIHRYL